MTTTIPAYSAEAEAPAATRTQGPTALQVMETWFSTVDPKLLHERIVWTVPGYPVEKQIYVGRDAVINEFFPSLRSNFSEWGVETDRMIDGGTDVTVLGRYVGKTMSGKPVSIPFIHVWTVENGQITRVVSGADTRLFDEAVE